MTIRFDSTNNIQCEKTTHDDATCLIVPEGHDWENPPPEGFHFEYPGVGQLPVLVQSPDPIPPEPQ
jgi:hypothetical protein